MYTISDYFFLFSTWEPVPRQNTQILIVSTSNVGTPGHTDHGRELATIVEKSQQSISICRGISDRKDTFHKSCSPKKMSTDFWFQPNIDKCLEKWIPDWIEDVNLTNEHGDIPRCLFVPFKTNCFLQLLRKLWNVTAARPRQQSPSPPPKEMTPKQVVKCPDRLLAGCTAYQTGIVEGKGCYIATFESTPGRFKVQSSLTRKPLSYDTYDTYDASLEVCDVLFSFMWSGRFLKWVY